MLTLTEFFTLVPTAQTVYVRAFQETGIAVFTAFEITTKLRLTHFLAQVVHESGGLAYLTENLNYRTAARLMTVWPKRFPTLESAQPYVMNPRALANKIYGGRNGNLNATDGYTYRGRGLIQITGRANYQRATDILAVDFINQPELVITPEHALWVAGAAWTWLRGNEAADLDDIRLVTFRINGGYNGIDDRKAWMDLIEKSVNV